MSRTGHASRSGGHARVPELRIHGRSHPRRRATDLQIGPAERYLRRNDAPFLHCLSRTIPNAMSPHSSNPFSEYIKHNGLEHGTTALGGGHRSVIGKVEGHLYSLTHPIFLDCTAFFNRTCTSPERWGAVRVSVRLIMNSESIIAAIMPATTSEPSIIELITNHLILSLSVASDLDNRTPPTFNVLIPWVYQEIQDRSRWSRDLAPRPSWTGHFMPLILPSAWRLD